MFKQLREDINRVDLEVKKLQQAFHFVLNDYDYHHENNEKEVIARKKADLDQVEEWCTNFKDNSERLMDLMETAKKRTTLYDAEIRKLAKKHEIDISAFLEAEQTSEPDAQKKSDGEAGR